MINKINKLPQSEFTKVFANIFENARWIAEELYKQKPFNDFEHLSSKMLNIFEKTNKENQLKILNNHPDLTDKTKINLITVDSQKEQNNSGLNQCSEKEYNEFKSLNYNYKTKFGFPFIVAVKGKNKNEILDIFKKRILNNLNDEFREATMQVKKIANLRLNELNIE
jgi:OHCU decarboxylase